jgi:DNA-binding NtrC family response regulator
MDYFAHPSEPRLGNQDKSRAGRWHVVCLEGIMGYPRCRSKNLDMETLRVLVVDDESLIRWAVTETLTDEGHDVVQATDATSALRAVRGTSEPFDVVLLDVRLPDSDDFTLLQRIRRLTPASAVVMMTAHGTTQMTIDAKDLGAYDVITKPFDVQSMAQVLVHASRSKSL